MRIPLVDLKRQYAAIQAEIQDAIGQVLESSSFILGEHAEAFEAAFAGYCGAQYAVGTSSGTSALALALLACGIGEGQEVITAPNTFAATAEAICHVRARAVFAEIDEVTYTLDPSAVSKAITDRTKAIIPVHLYGHPADMRPLLELAESHDLKVIEDAAQAHGAEYHGARVGSLGHVACFSFYPAKNLGAYGDAGMVVTNDPEIRERARRLRDHGRSGKYTHAEIGYNFRLDALQAAVLNVKLKRLDEWNEQRRRLAARYDELLAGSGIATPSEAPYAKSVYHLYVVRLPNRSAVQDALRAKGIATGIHYPLPLHLQPAFASLGYGKGQFPITERYADEILSLPMFPELREDEVERICREVKAASEEAA